MPTLRRVLALLLGATALVFIPSAAEAAGGTAAFSQRGGEWVLDISAATASNGHRLHVSGDAASWTIDEESYDQGARLPDSYPGECTHQVIDLGPGFGNEEELHCVFAHDVGRVEISAGDGNDQIVYTPSGTTPGTLYGGKGNDFVAGGRGDDVLYGDSGATDQPGDGQDTLDGGCGVDAYHGGGAIDVVSFQATQNACVSHRAGVEASLDDQGNDGPEDENIGGLSNSIEGVVGTDGDDLLSGNAADNYILGSGGEDRIEGLGGPDELSGGAGDDLVIGGPGKDKLYGDGTAPDSGDGNDTLRADDGEADTIVDCGGSAGDSADTDSAAVDAKVLNCESVHRSPGRPTTPVNPTVVTEDISLVTSTTARLFADVNAHGTTGARYYWLLSPKYGTTQSQLPNPGSPLPADTTERTVSQDVSRLQPGTAYLVRACVSAAAKTTCGAMREFATAWPPAVAVAGVPASATTTVSKALGSSGLAAAKVAVTPKSSGQEMLATYTLVKAGSALPTSSLAAATASAVRQVSTGAASLLPPASSLITNDGGSLITNDGGSLITNDGGSLINNGGSTIVASGAGNRLLGPQFLLNPAKKKTKYLLVLVSYVKKSVKKNKRVVLTMHYTRAGAKIMRAAHAHNKRLRTHHKKLKSGGFVFRVDFRKRGQHKHKRSGSVIHVP